MEYWNTGTMEYWNSDKRCIADLTLRTEPKREALADMFVEQSSDLVRNRNGYVSENLIMKTRHS
jgi:hypothetical protein